MKLRRLILLLATFAPITPCMQLHAQSTADSIALGRAVARTILRGLQPATNDSMICRVSFRSESAGPALSAGFQSEIDRVPGGAWILAKPDAYTPVRGWTLLNARWRGDSAWATVSESARSLQARDDWHQHDYVVTFVRDGEDNWLELSSRMEYAASGATVGPARVRCRPV